MASPPSSSGARLQPLRTETMLPSNINDAHDRGLPWLTILGLCFLTLNSGMAIYRSQGDAVSIAFVTFSYISLMLLFGVLRRFDGAAVSPSRRNRVKLAVWVLSTSLAVLFAWKVATVMPLPIAAVVWAMAVAAIAGLFWAFSFLDEEPPAAAETESWV